MTLLLMLFISLFIIAIQASLPYLLKPTIVFGVTVPSKFTKQPALSTYKRRYSLITATLGVILTALLVVWAFAFKPSEEAVILYGLSIQFGILLVGMALYLIFNTKVSRLKSEQQWASNLKEVKITDLTIRTAEEMLPWYHYLAPILMTIGMIAYTASQYATLPGIIPTHWGFSGEPDAFTEKTPFTAVAMLLVLLVLQVMMIGINEFTKKSGVKINALNKKKSRAQQLSFRKYTSWFLFTVTVLLTILFLFQQLVIIQPNLGQPALLFAMPIGFLVIILTLTILYAFKVGQSGTRLKVDIVDEEVEGITNYDDDQYWKKGVFYFNKNDPSIFVEKRFGVGWTINFANPLGYLILFGPIIVILMISVLL